jgi:tyrosine-protein kinase Etk/Wzc
MATISPDIYTQNDSKNQGEQIQRLVYRILPYWPLVIIALVIGFLGAKMYVKYQVSVYQAKARLVINDDSQQKSANLQEIFKLENESTTADIEREMQVITSSELLKKIVIKMQLNVLYIGEGRIKSTQYYHNVPFKLELENPELVQSNITGEAKIAGNKINFNGVLYPLDSLVASDFGKIRWCINKEYVPTIDLDKLLISIQPISASVERLKESISVAPISKGSSIVDLSLTDVVPERAIDILNNIIHIYGTSTVDYKSRIYENTQKFLDGRLKLVADELSGVEKQMTAYKLSEGIVDLGKEGELYLNKLKEADVKIAESDVQLDVLKQTEEYVRGRNKIKNAEPASLGISDPVLTALLNQLYQTEFELEKTRQVSGNKNPQIVVYEELITKLKPSILTSIDNLRNNLLISRKRVQADNRQLNADINKIPLKQRNLLDINRQQSVKNAIYIFLLQKREESAIAAASIVSNYWVLENPQSEGVIYPVPKRNYAIGILAALFFCILFIFLNEFTSQRVLFRSQIENLVGMPVLAELIFQPHSKDSPIVVGPGKRSLIAEQFRELRTNLNYVTVNAKDKCKVILITSSIPGEGKSFVAINTAISLSLTGKRVALMECDLRKPKISKPMGIDSSTGISNYLIGKAALNDIIQPYGAIESLSVISSGPIPPNPAELFGNIKFQELITDLKKQFDYLIVDTPPVAAVTDAKIIGAIADTTIYVIRHNYTNTSFLNLIRDIGQKQALPNINLVLNGIVNKKILGLTYGNSGGYSYGYGYGYGYGYTDETKKGKFSFKKIFKTLTRWGK